MHELASIALITAALSPLATAVLLGLMVLLSDTKPSERVVRTIVGSGLLLSLGASVAALLSWSGLVGNPAGGEIDFGDWLRVGTYHIPAVANIDAIAVTLSVLGAALTWLVARFSQTYLHKEPGFTRFYVLLALFASGLQLVAYAGALDLFFAGWELMGISSAFFIGFFHEREEPIRSSIRAFTTYRICDAGFLIGMVSVHELLGSTKFSALGAASTLPTWEVSIIAALFLVAAMGKSAMLPFSGWLPRAMEGPTPSSALFYGALSIHMGLFLLLRIWPLFEVSLLVRGIAVAIGIATAIYGAAVARTHTDAKGTLAHATLSQVGLILAEIALGFTTIAMIHIACHAMLRLFQYLRAPNAIHDAHRLGHVHAVHPHPPERREPSRWERLTYVHALHRLRIEDMLDALVAPIVAVARGLDAMDVRLRRVVSVDRSS